MKYIIYMEIRKATPNDLIEIEACVKESFEEYIPLIRKKPAPMLKNYKEIIEKNISGVVVIFDTIENYMWLDTLSVFKKYQGQGIGKQLIIFTEDFIREKKKVECRLRTNIKFENTVAIYRHLNYIEYQRILEDGYDRIYFKKILLKN